MTVTYDAKRVASFYDAFGEREWTRFDGGRTPGLDVYLEYLRRYIRSGDRVLEIGAGPGRFTIELARLGADIVVADLSPGQLELNRRYVAAAGAEGRVLDRVVADVADLSRWETGAFDVAVCYGGPLSYLLDRDEQAVAELVRVTRLGGVVILSVMSLVGALMRALPEVLKLARRDGPAKMDEVVRTGILPPEKDYGQGSEGIDITLPAKLYRWSELETLLARHGTIVAASGAGLLRGAPPEEPELRAFLARTEVAIAAEPGAISAGEHIVAVLRKDG